MAMTGYERVKAWKQRQSLKTEALYISGQINETKPVNGHAANARKLWRVRFMRRALARDAGLSLPPIKSKR